MCVLYNTISIIQNVILNYYHNTTLYTNTIYIHTLYIHTLYIHTYIHLTKHTYTIYIHTLYTYIHYIHTYIHTYTKHTYISKLTCNRLNRSEHGILLLKSISYCKNTSLNAFNSGNVKLVHCNSIWCVYKDCFRNHKQQLVLNCANWFHVNIIFSWYSVWFKSDLVIAVLLLVVVGIVLLLLLVVVVCFCPPGTNKTCMYIFKSFSTRFMVIGGIYNRNQ